MSDATIIVGKLNDEELRKSIDSLVTHIKSQTDVIKSSFDGALSSIESKVKNLSSVKADNGVENAAKKGTQANKELKMSFDEIQGALQMAQREVRKWESHKFLSPEDLNKYSAALQRVVDLYDKLNAKQAQSAFERADFASTRNAFDAKTTIRDLDAVDVRLKQLNQWYASMEKNPKIIPSEYGKQLEEAKALRAERERISNIMKDEAATQQQVASSTQQTAQAAKQYTEEVTRQAQAIRESAQWQKKDQFGFRRGTFTHDGRSYPVSENVEVGLRLEDQIVSILQRANEERQKGVQISQQQTQVTQQQEELNRRAAESLGWTEVKARKPYVSPTLNMETVSQIRGAVESITRQQEKWIEDIDKTTASYNQLARYVKELKGIYNDMSRGGNEKASRVLADEIQRAEREMRKFQQTLSRPISIKAALGDPEKTLDDIAYKIQRLQSYKRGINITDPKQAGEIKQVDAEINRLNADLQKYMGTTQQAHFANNALTRSWNYMKNRLAFYFTVGASTQFIKQLIDVRGQYELLERSIGILVDSAQNGSKIFSQLNAMAIKSPFTTMELGAAAKQLVAYDVAAKDVVDTTRRLADMAAAVGIPIERLTYALGQIKAYGYLNARDARMFANAGIPLVKELADHYTKLEGQLVSQADIYDRIKKKAIDYRDVMEVINRMTDEGGKFFNFQEKAADTLKVKIANLTLAWNNMLNEMGKDQQGVLSGFLKGLTEIFKHWRDIENTLLSIVTTFGVLKAAQIGYLVLTSRTLTATRGIAILQTALGAKMAKNIANLGASFMKLLNPLNLAVAAVAALSVAIVKGFWDYNDLIAANKEFNKSIVDAAEENIKSIDKFFSDYKNQLETVGGASPSDQQKMWERIQEEIEKSSKNAEQYITKLNEINNVADRIRLGEKILEQTQVIEKEAKRLASEGIFKLGGGFWNDKMAEDLKDLDDASMDAIEKFGSLSEMFSAIENKNTKNIYTWNAYTEAMGEAQGEVEKFVSFLNRANIGKIMGDDFEHQLSNIRAFANNIRDLFLATEDGQKVGAFGLTALNAGLDAWVAKTATAHGAIRDTNIETVEKNRTAWETFFEQLNKDDRERLDYLIETNQTGSKDFEDLWKKAADEMSKDATASYQLIKDQIKDLRNTAPIVIRVIYKQSIEQESDEQIKAFREKYLKPKKKGDSFLPQKEYFEEYDKNVRTYGKFIKKQGEDNVEWEERLGKAYQDNAKKIKSLNSQIGKSASLSAVDKKAKEEELQVLQKQQKTLKEIEKDQGFNYDQFEKGKNKNKVTKKDPLGDALAKYAQLITDMQKRFKEYRQTGVKTNDALRLATSEYGKTLSSTNAILNKFGIATKTNDELAKMDLRALRDYFNAIKGVASIKGSAKGLEAIEKALASINVEITKADYTKIVDGLNSELGKLKEEYELGVELSTDPEMGDMFAKAFNIDVEALPKSFGEALDKANEIVKDKLKKLKIDIHNFGLLDTLIEPDDENKWAGLDFNSKPVQDLIKLQKTWRDMFKKIMVDTEKDLDDYVKKYGGYSDKIAEIEADRLEKLERLNEAYRKDELKNTQAYRSKLMAIEQGTTKERNKAEFEEFKNSNYYVAMFENLEYASTASLNAIRERLSQLKESFRELTPEQLKWVTQQYEKIDNELLSRNPFKNLTQNVKNYIEALKNGKAAEEAFLSAQQDYDEQKKVATMWKEILEFRKRGISIGEAEIEQISKMSGVESLIVRGRIAEHDVNNMNIDAIEKEVAAADELLAKLLAILNAAEGQKSKYDFAKKLLTQQGKEIAKVVGTNLQSLGALRDFVTQDLGIEISEELDGMVDGLTRVGDGVNQIVSSLENADFVGALVGVGKTIYGIYDSIASVFGGGSARDKKITRQIEESERAVKRLENTYKSLEHTASNAYGAMTSGASYATKANKELQLVELQRQLVLEKSRKKKKQDQDKIIELEGQIMDLKNELNDATRDIVNDLLGISSAGDGIENLVSVMIEAFRNGEDAMEAFGKEWDKMIDNMILKLIVSTFMQKEWDKIMAYLNKREEEMLKSPADAVQKAQAEYDKIAAMSDAEIARIINPLGPILSGKTVTPQQIKDYREAAKKALTDSTEVLNKASYDYTKWTMEYMNTEGRAQMTSMAELLKNSLGDWYTFGENNAKDLSALQAGIQGITEETAGALEAITNSISQQVYLQSNILTQIRDAVLAIDHNAQTATQAEMLLQLQNNYILMQTMASFMRDWTVPSGNGIRVELMS